MFSLGFMLLSGLASAAEGKPLSLWVAPYGNDSNSGTQAAPFRTLERARDAVRALEPAQRSAHDIIVYLKDGTYRLERPLQLDARDAGQNGHNVIYSAASGARPLITGSMPVGQWSLHDKELNIYKSEVGRQSTRQLYVNGQRATRARTESYPAGFRPVAVTSADQSTGGGILYTTTPLNPAAWRDPSQWSNPQAIEVVGKDQWKMASVPIASITTSQGVGVITLQQPGWTNTNISTYTMGGTHIWNLWQVERFENAYEFLDQPGEWYLNQTTGWLYYIPRKGEDMATAKVELPRLEVLVEGRGEPANPVSHIHFQGLTFSYATWLEPGGSSGYVSDQSGFHLVGSGHTPTIIGHSRNVVRTPGNLRFYYAQDMVFQHNSFEHLGAVALDFPVGAKHNTVERNRFIDISSAAIQLGGVSETDAHPPKPDDPSVTSDNTIANNTITFTGREFVDSAAIFVGFTRNTTIEHNTISDVPWSGIAIGWGWGLLDPSGFPGVGGASWHEWGKFDTPTPNSGNRILYNRIERFLGDRWDGGAIYTTGQQGSSMNDALLIQGNVASGKRPAAGGNTFYTDGGSRYITLKGNVSINNPIGGIDMGPAPRSGDPLPYSADPSSANKFPYGSDSGGCRTYGDIQFDDNYWMEGDIPTEELRIGLAELFASGGKFDTYSAYGYFNICPYSDNDVSYPTNLRYSNNHDIADISEVPSTILGNAGVQREK